MKETWRQQLREKLADYEEPAPDVAWEEIEQAVARRQRRRVIPFWGRRIAAAAAILLIAGAALLYERSRKATPEAKTSVAAAIQQNRDDSREGRVGESIINVHSAPSATTHALATATTGSLPTTARAQATVTMPAETTDAEPTETPTEEQTVPAPADSAKTEATTQQHRRPAALPGQDYAWHSDRPSASRRSANLLTAKVFFSNTVGSSQSLVANAQNFATQNNQPQQDAPKEYEEENNPPLPEGTININDDDDGDDENDDKQARTRTPMTTGTTAGGEASGQESEQVSHRQPIRLGLLLRYQLSRRWALESGVTYTRLAADITRAANGSTVATMDQMLHYIGIPLTASYLIYKNRHLGFYASGGLLAEKMVYGSRTEAGSRQRVSIGPLQLSVNAGLGAEWRFIPALSLFVEPGLGYYFDNHSAIPTFYQEHPLSFNLNLGLRFSFE